MLQAALYLELEGAPRILLITFIDFLPHITQFLVSQIVPPKLDNQVIA